MTFAVRGVPSGFTHATLRLYVTGSSVKKTQVFTAASNWDESLLTWNNAPNLSSSWIGHPPDTKFSTSTTNTWIKVDLGTVFGDGNYTYALGSDSATDSAKFASRESAHPPELVLDAADRASPEVQLIQPRPDANVNGTVTLTASATDNVQVSMLEFLLGNTSLGQASSGPTGYTLSWDSRTTVPGTYTLTARATDRAGNVGTAATTLTVANVPPPLAPPTASFTAGVPTGTAPLAVSFTNTSTGNPVNVTWSFGDGSPASSVFSPTHVYAVPGTYSVVLFESNAAGGAIANQQNFISVAPFNRPGRRAGPTRVLLFGNSINGQYATTALPQLVVAGYQVEVSPDFGIGLLTASVDEVARSALFVNDFDPDEVVLENVGNYFQSDSIDPSVAFASPQFFNLWGQRAGQVSQNALSHGASVWWIDDLPMPSFAQLSLVSVPITGLYHDQHNPDPTLRYIDAFYPFGGPNEDFSLRGNDGVHLNSAGAQKLTDLVAAALVAPPSDVSPPSTVTLSGAAPDSTKAVLNWTAATDSGSSGVWAYRVHRSDQPSPIATMDNPETPTYTDTNVASGTTYTYTVTAVDAAGNEGATSNSVDVVVP